MNNFATFFRESRVGRFFIPVGIILIVFSIFLFIAGDHNKNYIATESTVSKVELVEEEYYDLDDETSHDDQYEVYVKYTASGKEYESDLGQMTKREVADKISIVYNPDDPTQISMPSSILLNIVLLVAGIASIIGGIISVINAINRHKKMKAQEESWKNGQ